MSFELLLVSIYLFDLHIVKHYPPTSKPIILLQNNPWAKRSNARGRKNWSLLFIKHNYRRDRSLFLQMVDHQLLTIDDRSRAFQSCIIYTILAAVERRVEILITPFPFTEHRRIRWWVMVCEQLSTECTITNDLCV